MSLMRTTLSTPFEDVTSWSRKFIVVLICWRESMYDATFWRPSSQVKGDSKPASICRPCPMLGECEAPWGRKTNVLHASVSCLLYLYKGHSPLRSLSVLAMQRCDIMVRSRPAVRPITKRKPQRKITVTHFSGGDLRLPFVRTSWKIFIVISWPWAT